MTQLPTEDVQWAENPAVGAVTEPSLTQKRAGWDTAFVYRQYLNFWKRSVSRWIGWLKQATRRTSDFHADQALPDGTEPAIGPGLTIVQGSFSARVYVDGYEVALSSGPNEQSQIFVTPAAPNNSTLYRLVINGSNCDYTTDGSATQAELRDGMVAAINANGVINAAVTAVADGNNVRVTQDVPGAPFTYAIASGPSQPLTLGSSTPDYVYSVNSDTYWDLSRAGVWHPVIVASGAGEPAVTANSVRVYRVRTDATDRTALVDRRRSRVAFTKNIDHTGNERFITDTNSKGSGASTDAELLASKQTFQSDVGSGRTYQAHTDTTANDGTTGGVAVYTRMGGIGLSLGKTIVWGARLTTQPSTWTADKVDVYRLDIQPQGSTHGLRFFRKTGLTLPFTFDDSEWDDELAANTTRMQLPLAFGLKLGVAPFGQMDDADANLTALLEFVRNAGGALRTLVSADLTAASESIVEYIGVQSATTTYERVFNATWNDATEQWARTVAGNCWRLRMHPTYGFTVQLRAAASASPWTDGSWTDVLTVQDGLVSTPPGVNVTVGGVLNVVGNIQPQAHIVMSEVSNTPAANSIYADLFPKARGSILTDGASGLTSGANGTGYTAAISGTSLRLTFTNAFSGEYEVIPSLTTVGAGPGAGARAYTTQVSSTVTDIVVRDGNGTLRDLAANIVGIRFVAFGRQ